MAYNSTIRQRIGECEQCGKEAPLTKKKCPQCYWNGIRMKSVAKQQEREIKPPKLKSEAKISSSAELDRWFKQRRSEMCGFCDNCGKPSCKNSDKYYKFSIAHILPKAYVKSVATHEKNWLELCFWGENSCHSNYDSGMLDLLEMNCFSLIIEKMAKVYPDIAKNEKRRVPSVLLEYIKTEI